MKDFGTHEELKEGEVFVGNTFGEKFHEIPSVRYGKIAYDTVGKVIPLARPIFISKAFYVKN